MYHEHPLLILRYSLKNIWLLVFPLLRGVSEFRFNAGDFYTWVRGAWFDIAVLGAILLFGFVRWYFARVSVTDESMIYRNGVILRVATTIPLRNISVASVERPFYLLPFSGVRFTCDTRAGLFKSTDMKVMVTGKVAAELMKHIPDVDKKNASRTLPRPNAFSVLLFSVFFSSGFSGAVYIATFFFKGGDIAHDLIILSMNRITETTEKLTSRLLLKIPGAAVAVGVFFLAAWLLSFIVNLLRYSRFSISSDGRCINVECGVTNRREYRINASHINYTDLRQNLIMKLAGAVTVSISCAGYGYDSRHLPVLLPIRMERDLNAGLESIGIPGGVSLDLRPPRSGLWSYICLPFTAALLVFPAQSLIERFFPQISELSMFAAIMLEIPCAWLIAVKTVALFTSGVSIYEDRVVVRYSRWTGFHTVIAGLDSVVKIELTQNLLQRFSHKCRLVIWLGGEDRTRCTVLAMRFKDVVRISKLLEYDLRRKDKFSL